MALTELYSGSNGTWGTEYSLTGAGTTLQNQTADGYVSALLDLNAMALGDQYTFRVYEKVTSGGTQRIIFTQTFMHAQGADSAAWVSPAFPLMHGWDFSLKRDAGSDRTILYSLRGV